LLRLVPVEVGRRVNNFGDLLGPLLIKRILALHNLDLAMAVDDRRLLSVGSVMHFADDDDVIWGTGLNGKKRNSDYNFRQLDVRAVRGPLTREFLSMRGVAAPAIFGDPALLLPLLAPELVKCASKKQYSLTVVPNFNDFGDQEPDSTYLDPRSPVRVCLGRIARSEFVVGSSLHAIVVAESLGIPARAVSSSVEDRLKYDDYYLGTGRPKAEMAHAVNDAVAMGGERGPVFDADQLLRAFPVDLWRAT
jgi:pyruvyltransferase